MTAGAYPPVLCYHRVGGPLELGVTRVARAVFARQMTALARAGWQTLTLAEFTARLESGNSALRTPHSALLLTFDDGYASLAEHAYPVLADLGFTATTFLITDYVGRRNTWDARCTWQRLVHLDWNEVERWRMRGLEFASHGATHRRLTWLADAPAADELARSREALMRRLGPEAGRAGAYPFGARDCRIERLAREAGYELGFGGGSGDGTALGLGRGAGGRGGKGGGRPPPPRGGGGGKGGFGGVVAPLLPVLPGGGGGGGGGGAGGGGVPAQPFLAPRLDRGGARVALERGFGRRHPTAVTGH